MFFVDLANLQRSKSMYSKEWDQFKFIPVSIFRKQFETKEKWIFCSCQKLENLENQARLWWAMRPSLFFSRNCKCLPLPSFYRAQELFCADSIPRRWGTSSMYKLEIQKSRKRWDAKRKIGSLERRCENEGWQWKRTKNRSIFWKGKQQKSVLDRWERTRRCWSSLKKAGIRTKKDCRETLMDFVPLE